MYVHPLVHLSHERPHLLHQSHMPRHPSSPLQTAWPVRLEVPAPHAVAGGAGGRRGVGRGEEGEERGGEGGMGEARGTYY